MKRNILVTTLIFCLLMLNFSTVAFAFPKDGLVNQDIETLYISKSNGSKVIEVKSDSTTTYVVLSESIKINDLSDEAKIKEMLKEGKNDKVIGSRTYFTFAEDFEVAKEIADEMSVLDKDSLGEVSMQDKKYFWHYSYIEDYYSGGYKHYHIHLSSTDVNYIASIGSVIAVTLAGVLAATGVVTNVVGVVLAGICTVAIVSYFQFTTNPDGSFDIYTRHADLNVNDNTVESGERLGRAEAGTGYWRDYWWPSNWLSFSL